MNEQVAISLISAVSGVVIAYIVNVAAKKVQEKKEANNPKDRMEQMFDGYERLIKQKDVEDDRKMKAIQTLEKELDFTRKNVQRLERALIDTQAELEVSRQENEELRDMLNQMREEYSKKKREM